MRVFDVLKVVKVNHGDVYVQQILMTDAAGKPNSVLTDLLRDVLSKIQMFVNLDEVHDVDEVIDILHSFTPLPDDVLDEYDKVLTQEVSAINFATRKHEIELVYDELVR
ncbi:hypothetical protein ACFQ5M_07595 [Agrilactobacillus yilanensis]|uniref:Uncharacterized protein n=1 Tax=Agrilactobacillus yilanensis TaxID=2485997 RepID=A0ABW4J7P8_9LACO|nr:hypothetical protein [Agrilactobacillus yilanensis]